MKNFKNLITAFAAIFILSMSFTANAADCSGYSKFSHKWNMCKVGKLKNIGSDGIETETVDNNPKKSLWHKIRTFGGKTTGEDK